MRFCDATSSETGNVSGSAIRTESVTAEPELVRANAWPTRLAVSRKMRWRPCFDSYSCFLIPSDFYSGYGYDCDCGSECGCGCDCDSMTDRGAETIYRLHQAPNDPP